MVFFRYLTWLGLTLLFMSCTDQESHISGKENPIHSIALSEIDVNEDFTSTSFRVTNQSERTYYSSIVVIAEYRKVGTKIGSERLVIYPFPWFGPDSSYVHEQPLHSAPGTDEIHFYVERGSFYPDQELKELLENGHM